MSQSDPCRGASSCLEPSEARNDDLAPNTRIQTTFLASHGERRAPPAIRRSLVRFGCNRCATALPARPMYVLLKAIAGVRQKC
jgi:hypothetical protein